MEGYYNLSPDIWGKIFTDCFSDGYIFCILYEFIHFSLPHFPLQFIKWVIYQTFVLGLDDKISLIPILYSIATCLKLH